MLVLISFDILVIQVINLMMSNDPNTWMSGMEENIQDTETKFTQSSVALCASMNEKLQNIVS